MPISPIFDSQLVITIRQNLTILLPLSIAIISLLLLPIIVNLSSKISKITGIPFDSIIPKKRKYWGIVYDSSTDKVVGSAVLSLFKDGVLIDTKVTDAHGVYGFLIEEPGIYGLEVQAKGFQQFITSLNIEESNQEIVSDIQMQKSGEKVHPGKFYLHQENDLLRLINITWTFFMAIGLANALREIFLHFNTFNRDVLVVYFVILMVNVFFLFKHAEKPGGKVLDSKTLKPIDEALVKFYNGEEQVEVTITNKLGAIKVNMKPGRYKAEAYKNGFIQTFNTYEVTIDDRGYMNKNLFLEKSAYKAGKGFTI